MKQDNTYNSSAEADLFDKIPHLAPSAQWENGLLEKMAQAGPRGSKSSSLIWVSLVVGCILIFNGLIFFRLENLSRSENSGRQQVLQHLSDELLITDKHTN